MRRLAGRLTNLLSTAPLRCAVERVPGENHMQNKIFSTDSAKAVKAQGFGYFNAIHYLAPAATSGFNLCSHASAACIASCLGWFSGQASMVADLEKDLNSVRRSRIQKAQRFMKDRKAYMRDVVASVKGVIRQAHKLGLLPCVRMNGSSDIAWEGVACELDGVPFKNIFEAFPQVQFIDYTKNHLRLKRLLPANYQLTLSYSGKNEKQCRDALAKGFNVAVIFDALPATYWGAEVIDGDKHDLRHLDPKGVIVGLLPKGSKAKNDNGAFVIRLQSLKVA